MLLAGCGKGEDANSLPECDAPEVQELARAEARQAVKVPFALTTFSEVESESVAGQRACRVRAKHAATGAAIWMRFALSRRPVKDSKKKQEELAVVFAPLE
ncbi:MAG: hypothetical protein ABW352_03705 [Polyangiales bacterium]